MWFLLSCILEQWLCGSRVTKHPKVRSVPDATFHNNNILLLLSLMHVCVYRNPGRHTGSRVLDENAG